MMPHPERSEGSTAQSSSARLSRSLAPLGMTRTRTLEQRAPITPGTAAPPSAAPGTPAVPAPSSGRSPPGSVARVDRRPERRGARQAVEVPGDPPELARMPAANRREEVDRGGGRVVGRPVGDLQPDARRPAYPRTCRPPAPRGEGQPCARTPGRPAVPQRRRAPRRCPATARRSARTARPSPGPPTGWCPRTGRVPDSGRGSRVVRRLGLGGMNGRPVWSNVIAPPPAGGGHDDEVPRMSRSDAREARQLAQRQAVAHRHGEPADRRDVGRPRARSPAPPRRWDWAGRAPPRECRFGPAACMTSTVVVR